MKNQQKKNLHHLKNEIRANKPEVLETFSEMQRSYLTDLSKQNTKSEQLDQKNYFLYLIEKLLFRM